MLDKCNHLLALNQQIRQAIAETDFARAEVLDQERRAFIATLDPEDAAVQDTLHATLNDLNSLTQTLEAELRAHNRQRRSAAQAQNRYRAQSGLKEA